jgi:hypothetical protein
MCVDCVLASPRIAQVDPGDEPLSEVVLSHQLGTDPGPPPRAKRARYRVRAPVTDGRDPPVSSRFPNPLPCSS